MAVIVSSLKLHWRGSTGSFTFDGPSYTAVYRLEVDDYKDQAKTVLNWFQSNVVPLGADYVYSNDVGLTVAVAKSIKANRILPSFTHWEITVEYGVRDEDDGGNNVDDAGNPTDDPTDWRPRIALGGDIYRRLVNEATYRGGYAAGFKYAIGTDIPPMNSAGVPFSNPPLEEDATQDWLILTTNVFTFDDSIRNAFRHNVDSDGFQWDIRNISGESSPLQAKIRRITAIPRTHRTVDYVEVSFEIDFATAEGAGYVGWRSRLLDQGTLVRACDADPDGRGGTVGGGNTPFPEDTPRLRAATDMHGERLGEVYLLDGAGQALDICTPADPVYGTWQHYRELPFTSIPILQDLITPWET